MADDIDDLDDLLGELGHKLSGWTRVVNPATGAMAYFPKTATDADAWEVRAIAQAEESVRQGIANAPPPKPEENVLKERGDRLRRGN